MPLIIDGAIACNMCGKPATHKTTGSDDHTCASCATHAAGELQGEQLACAFSVGDAVARAAQAGLTRDDLIAIMDSALDAPGPRFEWDDVPAVTVMDKTGGRYFDDRAWLGGLEPLNEEGTAS